ncbi:MAG: hypothetical protein LAT83_05415 [Kiritimatiellae bacterium]|nr:hypothetical protein [Kiritimatiellia bacterium]
MAANPLKLFASFATFCSKTKRIGTEASKESKGKSTAISLCALCVLLFKKIGGLERKTCSSIHPTLSSSAQTHWKIPVAIQRKRTGKYLLQYSERRREINSPVSPDGFCAYSCATTII